MTQISSKFKLVRPFAYLDARKGPHNSLAEALAFIQTPDHLRVKGLSFEVFDGDDVVEYQWKTADLSDAGVSIKRQDFLDALDGKIDDSQVLTNVPEGAVFTDTIYNDSAIQDEVDLNTLKESNVSHPLVETAVPLGAVFTDNDTVYTHPENHSPSIISQNATNRFVTDAEKATWNGKETPAGAQSKANTAEQNANNYADSLGSSLLSKSFTYNSGAQTFTADFDIVQVDSLLVGNTPLQRNSQYSVSGAVVTILDPLTSGAVIELNYWKANAVNAINYTKAESDAQFADKTDAISTFLSGAATDLIAGDTETFEAPYDFTLNDFWIAVTTAPTGSWVTVDVKKAGASITSTKASIESNEFSSLTGISPVLTTNSFVKGDKITPNISQVGSLETGKSLKIYLEITKI